MNDFSTEFSMKTTNQHTRFWFLQQKKIDLHWFCKNSIISFCMYFCMFESTFCGSLWFDSEWFVDIVFCALVFVVKSCKINIPFKPFLDILWFYAFRANGNFLLPWWSWFWSNATLSKRKKSVNFLKNKSRFFFFFIFLESRKKSKDKKWNKIRWLKKKIISD